MSFVKVTGLDHVGIRVSDFDTSFAFYKKLGFVNHALDIDGDHEISTDFGLRLNLIANAEKSKEAQNVLLDEPVKRAGYTHAAFNIENAAEAIKNFTAAGITITEGPRDVPRRIYFFVRDPDGNVLEFSEAKA